MAAHEYSWNGHEKHKHQLGDSDSVEPGSDGQSSHFGVHADRGGFVFGEDKVADCEGELHTEEDKEQGKGRFGELASKWKGKYVEETPNEEREGMEFYRLFKFQTDKFIYEPKDRLSNLI